MPLRRHQIKGFKGLFTASDALIPENALSELRNAYVDKAGAIVKRKGFIKTGDIEAAIIPYPPAFENNPITGLHRYRNAIGNTQLLATVAQYLYKATDEVGSDWVYCSAGLEIDIRTGFAQYGETLYFGSPNKGPFRYDGSLTYGAGLPPPTTMPAVTVTDTPSANPLGVYSYHFTYVYGELGESEPGPASSATELGAFWKEITFPGTSPRGDVTGVRIYRTEDGGAVYYRAGEIWSSVDQITGKGYSTVPVSGSVITSPVYENLADADLDEEVSLDKGLPPSGKFLTIHQQRMFVAGSGELPERVWFSDPDAPDIFADGNHFDVHGPMPDIITGLPTFPGMLCIFKRSGIWAILGATTDTFVLRGIKEGRGCVAPRSLLMVEGNLVFLSEDGVYAFDGVAARCLSDSIKEVFSRMNLANKHKAAACFFDRAYWLSYPSEHSNDNDKLLRFDMASGTWSEGDNFAASCFSTQSGDGQTPQMWFGSPTEGAVFIGNVRQFDGESTKIPLRLATKDMDFGKAETYKEFRRVWIDLEDAYSDTTVSYEVDGGDQSGDLEIETATDDKWGTGKWKTFRWRGSRRIVRAFRFPHGIVGRTLKLIIENEDRSLPWVLHGFTVGYHDKARWKKWA